MGCDGGTIPTRDELVRLKKKPEQKDKDSVRLYKWRHCSLSQEALVKPILSCELGRLYNKESILRHLLDKKDPEKEVPKLHIRGLKDVKELLLTPNPALGRSKESAPKMVDANAAPFVCPITGLEMNGRFKFVFDWSTGRVISERAYKILKEDPADRILEENLIILNPEENDFDLMNAQMEARRARNKADKKPSKRTKTKTDEEGSSVKKAKIEASSKVASTATSSVQSDASKSEVYKSIFSSHPNAQNQPKGNWVTFDPRYN